MNNLELFNYWLKRFNAKYFGGTKDEEAVEERVGNIFTPTEANKCSPVGIIAYNTWLSKFDWVLLKKSGITRSFVSWTNSMEPTMDYGDMVLKVSYETWKKRTGLNNLRRGDVAIYDYGGSRIVHRVVKVWPDGSYTFKGDNNIRPDYRVQDSQVVDVVQAIIFTKDKLSEKKD